jgi:GT2 family glycosyltransferase
MDAAAWFPGAHWPAAAAAAALAACVLVWAVLSALLWLTQRRTPTLEPPAGPPGPLSPEGAPWPRLSVIVPARDEAAHVERAVASLLAQDYPGLEVIAVDDRSGDATGSILERLAAGEPRLTVLHVEALPAGWLGKNHANHLGATRAGGDLLLFTDADVVYAPGALRAAVALLLRHGLGHLVAAPRLEARGYWERAFQTTFALYFALRCRLWALRRAGSAAYVGMGAFNLVRRDAYARVGGHARLALEVVDDVKLGLLLRRSGVPQGLASARDLISVRWQPGFRASLRGLLKNLFADAEYRWSHALGSAAALLALGGLPWALLAVLLWMPGGGPPGLGAGAWLLWALELGALVLPGLVLGLAARWTAGGSGLEGLAYPLMHGALAGVAVSSAALVTLRGGLAWRGTVYPLALLRRSVLHARDLPRRNAVGW